MLALFPWRMLLPVLSMPHEFLRPPSELSTLPPTDLCAVVWLLLQRLEFFA